MTPIERWVGKGKLNLRVGVLSCHVSCHDGARPEDGSRREACELGSLEVR